MKKVVSKKKGKYDKKKIKSFFWMNQLNQRLKQAQQNMNWIFVIELALLSWFKTLELMELILLDFQGLDYMQSSYYKWGLKNVFIMA